MSFDYEKHYKEIAYKYRMFIKDFELESYVELKANTGKNNCTVCHFRVNEPFYHRQAKERMFKLFLRHSDYLVESEVSAKKNNGELQVFDKGKRGYALDILAINVENLITLFKHVDGVEKSELSYLQFIEHDIMVCVEVDGDVHSWKKDSLRDKFFMEEYNLVTVRYDVADIVDMFKKPRSKYASKKHMRYYQKELQQAILRNISLDQVLLDAKAQYYKKYKNLVEVPISAKYG